VKATVVHSSHFLGEPELSPVGRIFVDAEAQAISEHSEWSRNVVFTDRTPFVAPSAPETKPEVASQPKFTPAITSAKE
jgi:hypothetical protein